MKITANTASARITRKIDCTTAAVVSRPSSREERAHLHAAQRPDQRDQDREHRRLDDADPERDTRRSRPARARCTGPIGMSTRYQDSSAPPASPIASATTVSAGSAMTRPKMRGSHQHLDRVHAHRAQRVDLVVQFHRADLGSEGAARAAGDDDRGQQHAELAQHGDRHEVDDEDLAAEFPELLGADVGDDHRDQEGDQRDDRHGGERRSRTRGAKTEGRRSRLRLPAMRPAPTVTAPTKPSRSSAPSFALHHGLADPVQDAGERRGQAAARAAAARPLRAIVTVDEIEQLRPGRRPGDSRPPRAEPRSRAAAATRRRRPAPRCPRASNPIARAGGAVPRGAAEFAGLLGDRPAAVEHARAGPAALVASPQSACPLPDAPADAIR